MIGTRFGFPQVSLPPRQLSVLVARYKKRDHCCTVVKGEDGKVCYRLKDGREFTGPSRAPCPRHRHDHGTIEDAPERVEEVIAQAHRYAARYLGGV